MWRMRRRSVVFGAMFVAAPVGVLHSQAGVELAPVVGVYLPLQNVIEQADGTSAKQATALAVGARISAGTHGKVSFDGTVTYVPSDVNASAGASGGSSSLLLIDARGVLSFGQPTSKTRFYLAAGPAVIVRNGEFYADFDGTTDVGGNVAAGMRIQLGKVSGRVEVASYLYAVNLKGAGSLEAGSQFQADLVATVSVAVPIGP